MKLQKANEILGWKKMEILVKSGLRGFKHIVKAIEYYCQADQWGDRLCSDFLPNSKGYMYSYFQF